MPELFDSAASGDRIATLRALRDRLAASIEDAATPASAVAALARQLTLVLAEIDELAPPQQKGTALDELASRRRAAGKPDASRSAGSSR